MNATGTNTAARVMEVAITAVPISSAASRAASSGFLPMPRWRTMFSISTIASSTSSPITTLNASRVIMFRLKPSHWITAKVGMMDSGRAIADTQVARQSRRNQNTTASASSAPSHSIVIDDEYERWVSSDMSVTWRNCTPGCCLASSANAARTASRTFSSSAPRERASEKPTTGLPSSSAIWVGSALPSCTVASASSRACWPFGRAMLKARRACASRTVLSVRTLCCWPASSVLPPGRSTCIAANCWFTAPAVMPCASRACGSRSTRICRSTPPMRVTAATPLTPYRVRAT